jgi:hypothetical protein
MKRLLALGSAALICATISLAPSLHAQEAIPLEEAQKIADRLASVPTGASDQPFIVNIDASKPAGLKGGDAGVIVLPDNRLNADALSKAGSTLVPVAQFWAYHVTPLSEGKSLDNSKMRTITVSDGDQSRDVQFFLLGLRKNDTGALELVLFGKGTEPVLKVPLNKGGADHDAPIELSGQQTGDNSATLTLNLPGGYTAGIPMVKTD